MKAEYLKESCVESYKGAINAELNGADLIELCSHLASDGLTPDIELTKKLLEELNIPIKVIIRPRKGDFEYNSEERKAIFSEIMTFKKLGVQEIVFGALKFGRLDIELIQKVIDKASPMSITIHKAIDHSTDIIDDVIKLNHLDKKLSILSSGGSDTAENGRMTLLAMKNAASSQINIIPAGRITYNNLINLHKVLKLKHYHGKNIVKS